MSPQALYGRGATRRGQFFPHQNSLSADQSLELYLNRNAAVLSGWMATLDVVEIEVMALIQMIPHRLVGIVTSVPFGPVSVAFEALPEVSMAVPLTKTARSMDEPQFMNTPQVLDNLAHSPKLLLITRRPSARDRDFDAHGKYSTLGK